MSDEILERLDRLEQAVDRYKGLISLSTSLVGLVLLFLLLDNQIRILSII